MGKSKNELLTEEIASKLLDEFFCRFYKWEAKCNKYGVEILGILSLFAIDKSTYECIDGRYDYRLNDVEMLELNIEDIRKELEEQSNNEEEIKNEL